MQKTNLWADIHCVFKVIRNVCVKKWNLLALRNLLAHPAQSTALTSRKPKDNYEKKNTWMKGIQKQHSYIRVKLEENKYCLLFWSDIKKQMGFLTQSASSWPFGIKLQIKFQ